MKEAEEAMRSDLLARGVTPLWQPPSSRRWWSTTLPNIPTWKCGRNCGSASSAAFLQAKKDCMEACLDQIVRWMHIVEIDPMLRLRMHQAMVDADYGRREELRLIEQLKQKESIISVWEKSLEAHKAAAAKAAVAAKA
ncbi:uncharacterized protein LOC117646834 isoform X1 [Thrips palmi]|uniref:Uncharacterized protein LOC117646834 isoform X1 n=1 Tax=Thrips palmi TaxID=161013 RepID=A0A6P8YV64_THRPL|nr:uncharacterized protein LOC117646834 isoform X1 [Thrips palmi]XP_034243979.1 uncharacterized protein LOC117646834 isoform X1 [Thrips palmi]